MSRERYVNLSDRQIKDTQNQSQDFMSVNTVCKRLNQQDERIKELEEQLKNMFTPKFKKGQEVWFVNNKTQIAPIKVIIGDIHFCWKSKNKFFYDGNMRLNFYEGLPENELFNTREEALAKLEELKGEQQ